MTIKKIQLMPSELKAIEEHKLFMSQRERREVSIEEAIDDFVRKYEAGWRGAKHKADIEEQVKEIEKHKWCRSEAEGRDIGRGQASLEWIQNYAYLWRCARESLEANGFLEISVVVENEEGLHIRPTSKLAEIGFFYDCDIYLHKENMFSYNFIMNGKKYLHVRSVLSLLALDAVKGEEIKFVATGREAKEALEAVKLLIAGTGDPVNPDAEVRA